MDDHVWMPVSGAPHRPPSPVHVDPGHGWGSGFPPSPQRPWIYDAHPQQSGWNATADGHAAALILNAAYDHAHQLGQLVPRLDVRWHRPDQDNVRPFGHNLRGDLAPAPVHDALDSIPRFRSLSSLENRLLHVWIDHVWLLHSRSPDRATAAVRRVELFDDDETDLLCAAIRSNALTDFRLLMLAIDARETPVYGRTRDGPGISRLYRRFPALLQTVDRQPVDHTTWDEDDGGESGSSNDETVPYLQTEAQRQAQRIRQAERRIRRVIATADAAEQIAERQERRAVEAVRRRDRGAVVLEVLLDGLRGQASTDQQPQTPS